MAKIDTSTIEGYETMTPEQKLAALEEFDVPEPDYTGYVKKDTFDKTSSELAKLKRESKEKLTDDERVRQETADKLAQMEAELDTLRREKIVSEHKARFIAHGYSETLADETAAALSEGDTAKLFANMSKFLAEHDRAIKAELLKDTPAPPAGKPGAGMTREKIMEIKDSVERQAAIAANIELFRKDE